MTVTVTRIADGTYRVEHEGRNEIVYVAGPPSDRWIFWNGQVYHGDFRAVDAGPHKVRPANKVGPTSQTLTAPMPARVSRIHVQPGAAIKKGDTVIVLEAMKMELPVRAPDDAVVRAVHCREGELVQADAVLMDLG